MALKGIKVIEMAGLAPAPFCGMILSDFGANVIRVDKAKAPPLDRQGRGKRSIALDLKSPKGISLAYKLCSMADVVIDPYRPGVMEKLGIGPERLHANNPRIVYARLTGFGQNGPYANMAGHDINYLALSGLLSMCGRKDSPPLPPQNMLADFGGGGLVCALGIVMALLERERSGKGQVVDSAMVDGAAYLGSWIFKSRDMPIWTGKRGENWFDGGLHYYETYETKDKKFISVGALEPQFYEELVRLLTEAGFNDIPQQHPEDMDAAKLRMSDIFKQKTQDDWQKIFEGSDACVTPVLSLDDAPLHPHNLARKTFAANSSAKYDPTPAPRLGRTPATPVMNSKEPDIGDHSVEILKEMGFNEVDVNELLKEKVVYQRHSSKL